MEEIIQLKVLDSLEEDYGRGIVRIDSELLNEFGIKTGEVLEIEGERKTVAIVEEAFQGDKSSKIIRMDNITRKNARTFIDNFVKVKKTEALKATKIVITPEREGIIIKASENSLKKVILEKAVTIGDIISLGGTRRRKTTLSGSPFFDDVFSMMEDGVGFADLKFVVAETNPQQAVIITESTEVILLSENKKEESKPIYYSLEEQTLTINLQLIKEKGLDPKKIIITR